MKILSNGQLFQGPPPDFSGTPSVIFAPPDKRENALALAGIDTSAELWKDVSKATRYENHTCYDYLSIRIPGFTGLDGEPLRIECYITKGRLVVLGEDAAVWEGFMPDVQALPLGEQQPARALFLLFTRLLAKDSEWLEATEDEIEAMEEQAVKPQPRDYASQVISLRKQLLLRKRYYQALYDLLEDLAEDQNNLFTKHHLRGFHLHQNRVERLLNMVVSLQDYLSQVREAFQNQLDISLNLTMRVFTVITAIFLPLTLIVGWYGMNIPMPEVQLPITYPIVIVLSVVIVVICLYIFKKKRWF